MARLMQCDTCKKEYFYPNDGGDNEIKITHLGKDIIAYLSFGESGEGYGSFDTCNDCFAAMRQLVAKIN